MSDQNELISYLKNTQICALPQSASEMIELSKDPDNGPKEYAAPISADLGLSTQVLRFVNSSFFGFRFTITSIPMALTLVSVRTIRNFVLWNGLFSVLPNPKCGPFSTKKLFLDSLRRAVFARIVTERYTSYDADEAFFGAMLQDMAIPILAQHWKSEYTEMMRKSSTGQVRLSTLEREKMGWDHSVAGGILANSWNLGEPVVRVIAEHTDTVCEEQIGQPSFCSITALSSLLPKMKDHQWHEAATFVEIFHKLFGSKLTNIDSILGKTDTDSEKLAGIIDLGHVPKTLIDYWQGALNGLSEIGSEEDSALEEMLEEHFGLSPAMV